MGDRGPLANPNARRRNARPAPVAEVAASTPAMPRTLKGEAAAEWKRIVPELEQMGVLATVDRAVLVRYCVTWADWVECNDLLQGSGKVVRGKDGQLVRNPVWLLRRDAETTLADLGRQLCLSPVARIRSNVKHTQDEQSSDGPTLSEIAEYRKRVYGA